MELDKELKEIFGASEFEQLETSFERMAQIVAMFHGNLKATNLPSELVNSLTVEFLRVSLTNIKSAK